MKVAFVTTQTLAGSTNVGRIVPLAQELTSEHEVHLLVHVSRHTQSFQKIITHTTGRDPFTRTNTGKKRLRGPLLVVRLAFNTLRAALTLIHIHPDVVVISKSLPESVFAAWLAAKLRPGMRVVLDVDDFELTANRLTSLNQRAAVHAAERVATQLADTIVAATPFLKDHFEQLTQGKKEVALIPTGLPPSLWKSVKDPLNDSQSQSLLYLGSISITSGHRIDLLPDIFAKVRQKYPAATLTVAGSGDDIEKLKHDFTTLGLSDAVIWHGRFTPSEVKGLVQQSTLLIDPIDSSITNRAKSSFRTCVATAFGKAIVTSDIGVRPYLVPQSFHTRFFAAPGEASGYAEKIIALLDTPLTETDRLQLREHAQIYRWDVLAQQYRAALRI